MSIYDYKLTAQDGTEISMEDYRGKVLVIFNSAMECAYTPQYRDFQMLYKQYQKDGLEILDFPCNQFGNQTPGTDEEIKKFCKDKYDVTFTQLAKADVIGDNMLPIYKFLTENSKFEGFTGSNAAFISELAAKMDPDYQNNNSIKWNFTKIVIDRQGNVAARYECMIPVATVKKKVEELL